MGIPVTPFWVVSLSSLVAVAVLMTVSFLIGRSTGKYSIIDAVWGPGFVLVAWVSGLVSWGEGSNGLRWTVLVMVSLWGLRLGGYILLRNHGLPEDARYVDMLADAGPMAIAGKVQVPQGLIMWFVSLPVQLAMTMADPVVWVVVIGVVVWIIGLGFESIGDAQLASFKKVPAHRGRVMDTGLWRFTRHPNYFGDATLWWGLFLTVAWHWHGWLTVLSPVLMTYLLVAKTGKALTEKRMSSSKPGYAEYLRRTSGFFPLPPKKMVSS